jgi:ribonuclease Z
MRTMLCLALATAALVSCQAPYPREFAQPTGLSQYNAPENWPKQFDRGPVDMSPEGTASKVLVIGSGCPTPNAFRTGPSLAVIVDGYPYFVDAGEGVWRGMGQAVVMHGDWLNKVFALENLQHMFLTHLHEDHTVGLPTWILSAYKFGCRQDKEIYGPQGTGAMIDNILAAWTIDTSEMQEGSMHQPADGSRANTHDLTESGEMIFQDDRVKVTAYRTKHGGLKYTFAYRFETPDRVLVFGGDGHYSEGLVEASKDADMLFIESCTLEDLANATWGGKTLAEKKKAIGAYHMFPPDLIKVKNESGVKSIVLVHEQNYAKPADFERTGLMEEIKRAGLQGPIYSSIDGDIY